MSQDQDGIEMLRGAAAAPDVPPARPRRRRTWLAALLTILALVLVLALAYGGFYLLRTNQAVHEIPRSPLMPPATASRAPEIPKPADASKQKPVAYVLLGSDSRGSGDRGRTDTIMIAYLSGDRKNAYLVSVPRDIWTDIPGHGGAKINAAYAWGGVPLMVQTLEQMTGVRMDHTALIDFKGFAALTEAVGGVEVTNTNPGRWGGFEFPAGTYPIRGEQALAYVQERYDLPNGDLDRNARQRAVTKGILDKALTAGVLANPAKFSEVMGLFKTFITFDDGLTDDELRSTATGLKITSARDVVALSAPVGPPGWSADGQWIWTNDAAGMAALGQAMRDDTMAEYAATHKTDPATRELGPTPSRTP